MSTVSDILKAVRDVIVMNERVTVVTQRLDRLEGNHFELADRVARVEAFIELARPAVARRVLPPAEE